MKGVSAVALAAASVLVAPTAAAATGTWTINLFCKNTGDGLADYLTIAFAFDALPANASGSVAGRHDYGAGPFDFVQSSSNLTADAMGRTESTYEVAAENLSFGAYAPAPGDSFVWRVVLDGHSQVLTGTAQVTGSGCAAATLTGATPTLSGQAKVGKTLTVAPGVWSPAGITFVRQWYADGQAIPGATGTVLLVRPGHLGKRISVKVTGSKSGYLTLAKASVKSAPVAAGTLSPAPKPKITGVPRVGRKLTVRPGAWGPGTVTKRVRWYAGGKAIKGATRTKLKLRAAHARKRITVKVTGRKAGYRTVTRASVPTKKVRR